VSCAEILDDALPRRVFVGRDDELSELRAGFVDAAAGNGRLFMIVGEPGIGKTRLALELAAQEARAARVLWGRCWEGGGAPAYWPWVQIIRAYVRHCDADSLQAQMGTGAAYLAHLVPELHERFGASSETPRTLALESEHARFQLFDAVTSFLRVAAAQRPLVLILDDAHAADQPSLLLLHFVARELRDLRVLMVVTYREVEVRHTAWRAALLGQVARESRRIVLRGLNVAAVAQFMTQSARQPPPAALVDAVYAATDGNPFFVDEVVRLLAAERHLQEPAPGVVWRGAALGESLLASLRVPDAVRAAIHRRLAPLGAEVRQVLDVASVMGREFEQLPLLHVCALPLESLLGVLAEIVAVGIAIEVPGARGRYAFAHALIRETLYDDLPPLRRVQLHHQIGAALELTYAADLEPHLPTLAHHFMCAAVGGDATTAVDYAARAGKRALSLLAYEDAAAWFERAVHALDTVGADPALRCPLLLRLGEALQKAGEGAKARATFEEAARVARVLGAAELLARAAVGVAGARGETGRVDAPLVDLLEEALRVLPNTDSTLRTAVLSYLAVALYFSTDDQRRALLSQEAVEMARRVGDAAALAMALLTRHFALWGPGRVEERLRLANELVELGRRAAEPEIVLNGYSWSIVDRLEMGDLSGARADTETYAQLVEQLRLPRDRWHATLLRAMFALAEGRFAEGEQVAQAAFKDGQRADVQNAVQFFGVQTFLLQRERGLLAALEGGVRSFVEQYPALPIWRCGLAFLYAELGRTREMQREFDRLAAHDFADLPHDTNWLPSVALLAEVCSVIGDTHRARTLYELLLPHATRNVVIAIGVICYGSAAHFERAIAINTQMGARPWAAYAQLGLARMLVAADSGAHGQPENRAYVQSLLHEVAATADALGMSSLAAKAVAVRATASPAAAPSITAAAGVESCQGEFHREGDYWSIAFEGIVFRLKDAKGLRCIAQLLQYPARHFHAIELDEDEPATDRKRAARSGDAGEMLDRQARAAYRQRLAELRDELQEAHSFTDLGRIARAQQEIDTIAEELAAAVGLGGRNRRAASSAERARVNVTRAISATLHRIAANDEALARYLAATIKTGIFCSYTPDPRTPVSWNL